MTHRNTAALRPLVVMSAAGLLLGLAACGGGGAGSGVDDSESRPTAAAAPGGAAFSSGIVGKSGVVNGVSWDGSRATVTDDRGRGGRALAEGVRVKLHGELGDDRSRGVADRIKIEPELRGSVGTVDSSRALPTFEVGGLRVGTDDSTVWAGGLSAATLSGRRVEVHGLRDGSGGLVATRVDSIDGSGLVDELRGVVGSAPSAGTFPIAVGAGAPVTVRFAEAGSVFTPAGCSAAALVAGRAVEVHGAFTAERVFTAQRIECEDLSDDLLGLRSGSGSRHEQTGLVGSVDIAARTLRLGSATVSWDDATQFRRGAADDLVAGARIEVEGARGADGRLRAREIRFESERVMVQGRIEAMNADGTLRILGRTVRVGPAARIESPVAVGAGVQVRGAASAAGVLVADRIEDPSGRDGREFIQARVTAKTSATITLLGTSVTLPANAIYRRADGSAFASMQAFLDAVVATPSGGSLVKVRGTPLASRIDEVEFER
jgi:hypothetical protein